MMMKQAAMITGAGRGIGRAISIELVSRGWSVAIVSRNLDDLIETRRLCGDTDRCMWTVGDVTDDATCELLVQSAIRGFGQIAAVINNAGFAPMGSIQETTPQLFRQAMETNVTAAYVLTRLAWPHLIESRGAVVNIGSESARDPFPGFLAYAPAKAALHMLTTMLHKQQAGVRAYTVAPAAVETKMLRDAVPESVLGKQAVLEPAEVARVVADCLAGSLRSSSGETIYVHR